MKPSHEAPVIIGTPSAGGVFYTVNVPEYVIRLTYNSLVEATKCDNMLSDQANNAYQSAARSALETYKTFFKDQLKEIGLI